ncbi:FAD-binding domain-containing protein [Zopfia rhizophila CBS 207.26]|uniref:FAD-binding domain-containing protein n=1 Tax=Zopfia rhizophila CBS 207.26 TaxID=1314779 RepID=A0A6A6DJ69_9PEZI|nr:FAD-binding domain-containing protein [Zopfia rhizophila CBS 207.26]
MLYDAILFSISALSFAKAFREPHCKTTLLDPNWPPENEWNALNKTIGGSLIKTRPVASSCYGGDPFNSTHTCEEVTRNWGYSAYHASLPESINYPIYAKNSCLPPSAPGYTAEKGCHVGGLPQYVVNATTEQQVATAMQWASERNIRIVVKGTGHDLNGRSSGAYSISIWTHNFKKMEFNTDWRLPGGNGTADVLVTGSGINWGAIIRAAHTVGKTLVGGQDQTVGLGGYIQGGGHGPLSGRYGLAADQILQAKVITSQGDMLVANEVQNPDLLWAIRGGGPGLYGVVTEYVLKTYPSPENVVSSTLKLSPIGNNSESLDASWDGFAALLSGLPDLMDYGLTGSGSALTGKMTKPYVPSLNLRPRVEVSLSFFGCNMTPSDLLSLLEPARARVLAQGTKGTLTVSLLKPTTFPSFLSFFDSLNSSPSTAGQASLISSRLLGRAELCDIPQSSLRSYLERIMRSQVEDDGSTLILGLQGGLGPRQVEDSIRGALNPAWRRAYVHAISTGASVDATAAPQDALAAAAAWVEQHKERVWHEWAPDTGAYMNEANCFSANWKQDFYGGNYDRLLEIKKKYDPSGSLFVVSGVGSDLWEYDMTSGRLCQKV